MRRNFLKIICFLFISELLYIGILYYWQNKFLFFPDRRYLSPVQSGLAQFTEQTFIGSDGLALRGWYAKGDTNKPAILFFHGNAGQIARFAPQMQTYLEAGYSVFMPEYRGFAGIKGELSQENIYNDALSAYDYLQQKLRHPEIILFGYSMGTAPATYVARQRAAKALILAAPFYSLADLVAEKPVPFAKYVLKTKLPSCRFIRHYKNPLLIIHGEDDTLIPFRHGRDLYNIAPAGNKTLILVPQNNHYQLYFDRMNHKHILDWLHKLQL